MKKNVHKKLKPFLFFKRFSSSLKEKFFKNVFGIIPTKIRNRLQFYEENFLKNESEQKKVYQKVELTINFRREIHLKIVQKKKFIPEIRPQKYPLGS